MFSQVIKDRYLVTSLDHLHKKLKEDEKVREHLQLPKDCVIHSLRHTFLTRFGEAGADAFTIKKVAGHSSVTISEALYSSYAGRPGARFGAFHHSEQQASKTIRSRYKFRYITKLIACKFLCPCSSTVRAADS